MIKVVIPLDHLGESKMVIKNNKKNYAEILKCDLLINIFNNHFSIKEKMVNYRYLIT